MAYAFDDPMAGSSPRIEQKSGGGWKAFLALVLAAAGIGFAGYVYFIPYKKLTSVVGARTAERDEERDAAEKARAERDGLKSELGKRDTLDKDRAASAGQKLAAVEGVAGELKAAVGELGATVTAAGGKATVSFPVSAIFEQPTSTAISASGTAALKVLAGVVKKSELRVRVKARLISSPPPRELAQFRNVGEFTMLRAARITLALADGGVAAGRLAAAAEAPPAAGRKGGKAGLPDRLEIEIEPE